MLIPRAALFNFTPVCLQRDYKFKSVGFYHVEDDERLGGAHDTSLDTELRQEADAKLHDVPAYEQLEA